MKTYSKNKYGRYWLPYYQIDKVSTENFIKTFVNCGGNNYCLYITFEIDQKIWIQKNSVLYSNIEEFDLEDGFFEVSK